MTIQELAKQDSREIYDQDVRDVQALLAQANENVPYNVEGEDQDERERIRIEGEDQDD